MQTVLFIGKQVRIPFRCASLLLSYFCKTVLQSHGKPKWAEEGW